MRFPSAFLTLLISEATSSGSSLWPLLSTTSNFQERFLRFSESLKLALIFWLQSPSFVKNFSRTNWICVYFIFPLCILLIWFHPFYKMFSTIGTHSWTNSNKTIIILLQEEWLLFCYGSFWIALALMITFPSKGTHPTWPPSNTKNISVFWTDGKYFIIFTEETSPYFQ